MSNVVKDVAAGNVKTLESELNEIDVYTFKDEFGLSLLHHAANNMQPQVAELLLRKGASVCSVDNHLNTPLHCVLRAADRESISSIEFIKLLAKNKANLNAMDCFGRTALTLSAVWFHRKTLKVLLDLGANPNIEDRQGLLPIHVCCTHKLMSCLKLLLERGALPDLPDMKGRTALYYSVLAGHQEVVELLVKHGCDVNYQSQLGSPVQKAVEKSNVQALHCLLNQGASVAQPVLSDTPLFSKASNIPDLSLVLVQKALSPERIDGVMNGEETCFRDDNPVIQALDVVELVLQACTREVKLVSTVRHIQSVQNRLKNNLRTKEQLIFVHRLKALLRQIAFSKWIVGAALDDEVVQMGSLVDMVTLQNICVAQIRRHAMKIDNTNIISYVKSLNCSLVVKRKLLLMDL